MTWPVQGGSAGINYDYGYGITSLSDGSLIVTGGFSGTASFGGTSLTSAGGSDVFITKLASTGQWDSTPPSAPATPDLSTGTDSGNSSTDNNTTDNTPTFTGTAEASSTVQLFSGTTSLGTTSAHSSTGAWSFTPTSALAEGTHSITAKATDAAGNISSASSALSINIIPFELDIIVSSTFGDIMKGYLNWGSSDEVLNYYIYDTAESRTLADNGVNYTMSTLEHSSADEAYIISFFTTLDLLVDVEFTEVDSFANSDLDIFSVSSYSAWADNVVGKVVFRVLTKSIYLFDFLSNLADKQATPGEDQKVHEHQQLSTYAYFA